MDERANLLHSLASGYVTDGLGTGDFDAIPYADDVVLRAPLCPGGSLVPIEGKENLRETWWRPLPDLVSGTEVVDTYVNQDQSAVTVEFLCHIKAPKCTLRIIDRFQVNSKGKIVSQENFFDPRGITNPE